MLAAWLYTDPYYGSKARAIRALNLTAAATQGLNESQVEFASGDPDLLNQTVMIKAPIPGPEMTQVSFMRSWMNYVYENKGLVGCKSINSSDGFADLFFVPSIFVRTRLACF